MKPSLRNLIFLLILACFPPKGNCAASGDWEFFDQAAFKPKMVRVDHLDRKWFAATDGIWMLDGSSWTRYTQSTSGIPQGGVNAMEVADDGAIWFGTFYNGAVRYDGTSWRAYNTDNSGIGDNRVNGIAFAPDGGVWIAAPGCVSLLKNGRWSVFPAQDHLGGYAGLTCAAVDGDGRAWFGTGGEGALRFDGSVWRKYTHDNSGLSDRMVHTIRRDPDGRMVFGGSSGAYVLESSSWKKIPVYSAESVAFDVEGMTWLSNEFGFSCHDGENTATFPVWNSPIGIGNTESQIKIRDMTLDRAGNLWFATGKGVYRFSGRFVQVVQPVKPQSAEYPVITAGMTLHVAWMARRAGKVTLDYSLDSGTSWNILAPSLDTTAKSFDWAVPRNFLPAGYLAATVVIRVTAVEDSSLTHAAVVRIEAPGFAESMAEFTPYNSGLASHVVRAMTGDDTGAKWFATDRGVSRFDGAAWRTFTAANSGLASDDVRDCARDGGGGLWFATSGGLSRYDGERWETWFEGKPVVKVGTGGNAVWAVCADSLRSPYNTPVNPTFYHREGNSWTPHRTAAIDTLTVNLPFDTFSVDPYGNVWLVWYARAYDSPTCSVYRQQLMRGDGAKWEKIPLDGVLTSEERLYTFTWDSTGKLRGLVATSGDVVSFDGTSWERIRATDGTGTAFPNTIQCDRDGVLWGYSWEGLQKFDGSRWIIWDRRHGWPPDLAAGIIPSNSP